MLSGSPTLKLTRNCNCGCPPNISIQSSEGRVAHGVWNAFTKLLRIDRAFPHFSSYPLSLGGWIFINTLFNNHKIEREAGVPFLLLCRQEKKRKLLIFCARVWSIQGIGRGEFWGNFQGKHYQERFATYRFPSFQSWYHSMVAGIFLVIRSMKKWWILHEKHRLFSKPQSSKKPWYLAWGNKTGF